MFTRYASAFSRSPQPLEPPPTLEHVGFSRDEARGWGLSITASDWNSIPLAKSASHSCANVAWLIPIRRRHVKLMRMCILTATGRLKGRTQLLIEFELSPSLGGERILASVYFGKAAVAA
jgi:hypothetical protein